MPSSWFSHVWNPVGSTCDLRCCGRFQKRVGISKLETYPPHSTVLVGPTDIFMTGVPDDLIRDLFMVMARHRQHNFRVLVRNAYRMEQWFGTWASHQLQEWLIGTDREWPIPNVLLGIVVSDQDTLEDRLGSLLASPAIARFMVVDKFKGFIDPTDITCPAEIYLREQVRACSICNNTKPICFNGRFNALRGGLDEVIMCDVSLDDMTAMWHDELRTQCDEHHVATIDLLDR